MKNLHLLPTENPSRLILQGIELLLSKYMEENEGFSEFNQHLYITSIEKIKEGVDQWYLDKFLNKPRNSSGAQYGEKQEVIILTTDKQLIKDGVQEIDDEFLQWFCKNPSCEEVFITNDFEQVNQDNPILRGSTNVVHKYKIIIPQEEPKKETSNSKKGLIEIQLKDPKTCEHFKEVGCIKDICTCYTLVPNQETLEEPTMITDWLDEHGDPEIYKNL
jgi:hypothetical protein